MLPGSPWQTQEFPAVLVTLIGNMRDPSVATDTDGLVIGWNRGAEELYGWTSTEALGYLPEEILRLRLAEEAGARARRALSEADHSGTVATALRKDGAALQVQIHTVAVRDGEGAVGGYVAVHHPVADPVWAAASDRLFGEIIERCQEFVGIADARGQPVFLNPAGRELVGLTPEESLESRSIIDFFHPDDRQFVAEELLPMIMRGERWAGERELRFRHFETGRSIPVLWDAFPIEDERGERVIALATVTRDITERKRAEEQQAYHAHLLEQVRDAVLATDLDGVLTAWNPGAEQMFGWRAEEALRRPLRELLSSSSDDGRLGPELGQVAPSGNWRGEVKLSGREGEAVQVEAVSTALRSSDGAITGFLWILRDISDWRRVKRELELRARQQAVVADLGLRALASEALQPLLDELVGALARTLEVEFASVAQLANGGREIIFRAGSGWSEPLAGRSITALPDRSLAATALSSGQPAVSEDLQEERRFAPDPLLLSDGARSAIAVAIPGLHAPWGVVGAASRERRSFDADHLHFVQAVANVVGSAVTRSEAHGARLAARERERRRIARELHDHALTAITRARAIAAAAAPGSAPARPSESPDGLAAALEEVEEGLRAAIYELRPDVEEDAGLAEALVQLVDQHRLSPAAPEIQLDLQGCPAGMPLGVAGSEVLRIIAEALRNAVRHADAEVIIVTCSGSAEQLCLEVVDDGRGFEHPLPAGGPGAAGLAIMRERASAIGGALTLTSRPGTGTLVRLELSVGEPGSPPPNPTRVLLVEDHDAVREALALAFAQEMGFAVVGHAASLREARRMLGDVDIAVVDLGLPDGYGGDLIRELKQVNPQAQAVVLTASMDRSEVAVAVERGAAAVIDKTSHLEDLLDSIKRLQAGETLMPLNEVVELLRLAARERESERVERRALASLTSREIEVLQALVDGLDTRGVAERLVISIRTARNHVSNILAKLDVHSQLQALILALRHQVIELPSGPARPDADTDGSGRKRLAGELPVR